MFLRVMNLRRDIKAIEELIQLLKDRGFVDIREPRLKCSIIILKIRTRNTNNGCWKPGSIERKMFQEQRDRKCEMQLGQKDLIRE